MRLCNILRSIFLAVESYVADERGRELSRSLQKEQDAAYQRSLAIDRERRMVRQQASSESLLSSIEAKSQTSASDSVSTKQFRIGSAVSESSVEEARIRLPPEPAIYEQHYRFSFQLPNGTRLVRRFATDCRIQVMDAKKRAALPLLLLLGFFRFFSVFRKARI
jgi:hypothetical protein